MKEDRTSDEAGMWCDLLLAHIHAESAHLGVTRRAELYMRVAGLPLDRVLDALKIDGAGWSVRVSELRQAEARNLAAADGTRS